MPLESVPARRIRLKGFTSVDAFNAWIAGEKGIVLLYLSTNFQGFGHRAGGKKGEGGSPPSPRWVILATYLELEKSGSAVES